MPFANPIIGGGGSLVYPSIHSPNFSIPLKIGWSIDKNGNAYFFGVVTSGTFQGNTFIINTAGIFIYTGTPAAGNLTISIASASGTDSFGNGYGAGFSSVNPGTAVFTNMNQGQFSIGVGLNNILIGNSTGWFLYSPNAAAGNLIVALAKAAGTDAFGNAFKEGLSINNPSGTDFIQMLGANPPTLNVGTGNALESVIGRIISTVAGSGATTQLSISLQSPETTHTAGRQSFVTLSSANDGGTVGSQVQLEALGTSTSTFITVTEQFASVQAFPGPVFEISDRTNTYTADRSFGDATLFSQTNPTSAVNISSTYTIKAGDSSVGTVYTIEVPFNGVWEASGNFNLEFNLNGTQANLSPIASGLATAGHNYGGVARLNLKVTSTGAGGQCTIWYDGIATDTSVVRAGSTSASLFGIMTAHAFNTTVDNTLAMSASFSVSNASQTIIGNGSTFTRRNI